MSITSFSPESLLEEADFEIKNPAILCVDDEQFILDSLYNVLEKRFGNKYQYEFAESGEEALNIVKELDKEGATLVMVVAVILRDLSLFYGHNALYPLLVCCSLVSCPPPTPYQTNQNFITTITINCRWGGRSGV